MSHRSMPLIVLAVLLSACAAGDGNGTRDGGGFDGSDTPTDAASDCTTDEDCLDDGIFCNGGLACEDGRCVAAGVPSCDDGVRCTDDECDGSSDECVHTPDNSLCPSGTVCSVGAGCTAMPPCEFDTDCLGDGMFCNGDEVCVDGMCQSPSGGRTCDDENSCTADQCVESSASCVGTPYPDHLTNPMHCGTGANDCVMCPVPPPDGHAVATCVDGACGFECEAGWYDADGDPSNWCETDCLPSAGDDLPDDSFIDSNCDGIDGDEMQAIFVAPTGRDSNPGTRTSPKRTLPAGIAAAAAAGYDVYVSVGVYDLTDTLDLAEGVSVYGGYDAAMAWARDNGNIVTLNGPATAVRASNITASTIVDRIDVTARSNLSPGGSSIAVHVSDSPGLTWRVSEVRAGDGAPGAAGSPGSTGGSGSRGNDSVGGIEYDAYVDCLFCSCGATRPSGPAGGASPCGRNGGTGGRGGTNGSGGSAGQGGSPNFGSAGSGGAVAGGGGSGGNGGDGAVGTNGAAGPATGSIVGTGWVTGNGGDGTTGGHGQGGGGGGGGGGDNSCCCRTYGDTGASGGGAGCGGTGGTGGGGGGGSIGFLVIRSSMTFETVAIFTGDGGDGGNGGNGGTGGLGADGGLGSGEAGWSGTRDPDNQGTGGPGGDGGDGGRGGHGGGGGGGPSVGILRDTASSVSTSVVTYTLGNEGVGGSSSGNNGARGARMNEIVL